ncbi:E3 ubiquitin-protein transferase RMND5A isoform X2 [Galendromus occidentalis]|uniref:E3 ubiquitin-protein transferase RMND5A isoform X2 n=1 Tax=Galendromus occidentalis TaxID=34638 RepID=A0AAJ6VVD6_9ACAR|nr:E3 ubiquitin-protein transferase RMND5A isoform X2 [Galendromus occidentalis]
MESCNAVEKEVDKVVSKLQSFKKYSNTTIQELIDTMSQMEQDFESGSDVEMTEGHTLVLKSSIQKIKDVTTALTSQHRELHGTVSRVGKAIDKNFSPDFAAASKEGLFEDEKSLGMVNQVVCEHFLRKGYLDIAEELMSEANLKIPENYKEPFSELNTILESLRQRNVQPALQWAAENRTKLSAQRSQLELKLHRLQFLNLLSNGATLAEAVEYARQHFQHLAERHQKEVQALMGCLLYINNGGLQQSPYARFLDNSLWTDIYQVFARDACALLGLSVESPLTVCVNAGCTALPSLLSIKQVMQQRQVNMWCTMDELPIEIHLGRKCQFHSIFACPILRQQSSDHNPPMRLVCGHVISRDALHKLANSTKLKCPYCPIEQNPNDAREIHF